MRRKSCCGGRPKRTNRSTSSSTQLPRLLFNHNQDEDNIICEEMASESNDWLKETCIICNKGGNVLRCTQTGCPLALHHNCMSWESISHDSGQFYCPYCSYKRALLLAQQLRKKAVLAKEALFKFLATPNSQDQHNVVVDDDDDEVLANPNANHTELQEEEQAEPFNTCQTAADAALHVSKQGSKDGLNVSEENKGSSEDEEHAHAPKAGFRNDDSDTETLATRTRRVKQRAQKKAHPLNVDTSTKTEENSTSKSRQPKESLKQYTPMIFPTAKRKRLNWTAEEEDMLKEGVHHFSASAKKNVPWRKILDLGRHKFHKSRTPADLKDKWRNMTAK